MWPQRNMLRILMLKCLDRMENRPNMSSKRITRPYLKDHPEIEVRVKGELVHQNLAMAQRDNNEGYGVVKLPVKVYGINYNEFTELIFEYHQIDKAHWFFVRKPCYK